MINKITKFLKRNYDILTLTLMVLTLVATVAL